MNRIVEQVAAARELHDSITPVDADAEYDWEGENIPPDSLWRCRCGVVSAFSERQIHSTEAAIGAFLDAVRNDPFALDEMVQGVLASEVGIRPGVLGSLDALSIYVNGERTEGT